VYPEGNYIRASDERPFLQIGESKYGKFLLELAVETDVDLATATKIAVGSMMSTAAANLSVGPPYDAGIYVTGSFRLEELRVEEDSALLAKLQDIYQRHLRAMIAELPSVSRADV
jgi:putative proteasome-type protease